MNMVIREMREGELEEMVAEHHRLNPDRPIKQDTLEALNRWRDHGILPGDFLTAVLENDLMRSFGRADSYNRATLFQITSYLYNDMPMECWGSPEKVKAWAQSFADKNGDE